MTGIEGPLHALMAGLVHGALLRAEAEQPDLIRVVELPVDEDGNYEGHAIVASPMIADMTFEVTVKVRR